MVVTEVGVKRGGCGDGHVVVGVVCPLPGKVAGQRPVGSAVPQECAQVSAQLCWQGGEGLVQPPQYGTECIGVTRIAGGERGQRYLRPGEHGPGAVAGCLGRSHGRDDLGLGYRFVLVAWMRWLAGHIAVYALATIVAGVTFVGGAYVYSLTITRPLPLTPVFEPSTDPHPAKEDLPTQPRPSEGAMALFKSAPSPFEGIQIPNWHLTWDAPSDQFRNFRHDQGMLSNGWWDPPTAKGNSTIELSYSRKYGPQYDYDVKSNSGEAIPFPLLGLKSNSLGAASTTIR